MPVPIAVALKEWAVVVEAIRSGRQRVLFRKGGIADPSGRFDPAHRAFWLFPTYEHQQPHAVRQEFQSLFQRLTLPPAGTLRFDTCCEVVEAVAVTSPQELEALEPFHIWTREHVASRFTYQPTEPLWVLVLRAYALPEPIAAPALPQYGGCKSWVTLAAAPDTQRLTPVLPDTALQPLLQQLRLTA
ncbi:MAG: DUF1802 family protein [Candidatus Omnitrophica bacterium]|nr:DUF1802 family protein [Candidatus Omnitrophota bacterium]